MPKKVEVTEEMWKQLETEYISTSISVRGLAKKYGIPYSQVRNKYEKENWSIRKEKCLAEATQKSVDLIATHQAEETTRAFRVANKVMCKIEEYVDKIDLEDEYAMKNLKSITSAIKDLKEIGLFRSMLDQAEQEARIKKLQKDAEEENKETTINVTFANDLDEYAE